MKKVKTAIVIVSILVITAVSIYAAVVYFPLPETGVPAEPTITMAPPSPDEVILFTDTPTTIRFSGVAYYGVAPTLKIRLVLNGYSGIAGNPNEHTFDFTIAAGYFYHDIVVPDDFSPAWYGTYDNYAQVLGENDSVVATSEVFTITYSPVE
jgi:hypothetical protein